MTLASCFLLQLQPNTATYLESSVKEAALYHHHSSTQPGFANKLCSLTWKTDRMTIHILTSNQSLGKQLMVDGRRQDASGIIILIHGIDQQDFLHVSYVPFGDLDRGMLRILEEAWVAQNSLGTKLFQYFHSCH